MKFVNNTKFSFKSLCHVQMSYYINKTCLVHEFACIFTKSSIFYNYFTNPCGQFLFYECQVLAFVLGGEPIKEVNHQKKRKSEGYDPPSPN